MSAVAVAEKRNTRRRPVSACNLRSGHGECVARLVTRLVVLLAAYDEESLSVVYITPDGGLYIEPSDSRQANWLRANAESSHVGTYNTALDPEDLEDSICQRLAEIDQLGQGGAT